MNKFILYIMALTFIIVSLSGCINEQSIKSGGNPDMNISNIPNFLRANVSVAIRRSGIESKYGKADIFRSLPTKSYEIRKFNDGSMLFVIYDNETNRVIDIWRLRKLFDRKDFTTIVEGKSTLNDVIKIDAYTNIVEIPNNCAISEHKLKNNEVCIINYIKINDVWTVNKISMINNDPSEFAKTILPEDLRLLT